MKLLRNIRTLWTIWKSTRRSKLCGRLSAVPINTLMKQAPGCWQKIPPKQRVWKQLCIIWQRYCASSLSLQVLIFLLPVPRSIPSWASLLPSSSCWPIPPGAGCLTAPKCRRVSRCIRVSRSLKAEKLLSPLPKRLLRPLNKQLRPK